MSRLSNCVFCFLNFCALMIGIAAISLALNFHINGGNDCQRIIQEPLLVMGVVIFVISSIGLIGACCKANFALWIYLMVMFFYVLGLFGFILFSFVITNEHVVRSIVKEIGIRDYQPEDFSEFLRVHFINGQHWDGIKTCLVEANVCKRMNENSNVNTISNLYQQHLTPIEVKFFLYD